MKARVSVRLKPAILDPQGKAVLHAARQLGYNEITSVRVGKLIELEIDAVDEKSIKLRIKELSRKLLSNPLMETFNITWNSDSEPQN